MRKKTKYIKSYIPWLLIIFFVEAFTALLLWLADIRIFQSLFPALILFSLFLFIFTSFILIKREINKEKAIKDFLFNPNIDTSKKLLGAFESSKKDILDTLVYTILRKQEETMKSNMRLKDYEEYVEVWAHEIKLPLSLLTLILDNEEYNLSEELNFKLDYIRNQIQSNILQILFYYRIRSEKKDYFFEEFNLKESIDVILEDYKPLLDEKKFKVSLKELNYNIYTDRRSFQFIIGQIINNSIKYSNKKPYLEMSVRANNDKKILTIKDNGQGVKEADMPHIFNKGFTGDSGDIRNKSTGMGLYLVKQLTDDLNIDIKASSIWNENFVIELII